MGQVLALARRGLDEMQITRVGVFNLEGETRSGMALYEVAPAGLAANEVTPYRGTFIQIETDHPD